MSLTDAATALHRFGLGPRPGELRAISADPRGWLHAQLARPVPMPARPMSSNQRLAEFRGALGKDRSEEDKKKARRAAREAYRQDVFARADVALKTEAPFVERLVRFWSNHFTVSATRPPVLPIAGPFEAEVIRPYVTGRFANMLRASARHPAMLLYLDNARSIGPNSWAGRRSGRGLNENYARELLELHTLGVDGGYTQDDVIELARILTGWMVGRPRDRDFGQFRFLQAAHEPGPKVLFNHIYQQGGIAEGDAALATLARHPSTARHIATKLARHFVADDPPPSAVQRLETVFRQTDGDLGAVSQALIDLPDAWEMRGSKVLSADEFVIASLRATGLDPQTIRFPGALLVLGQATWMAPSPAGWPDRSEDWIGPEAITKRMDLARALAEPASRMVDPAVLFEDTIGPIASETTRFHALRAPSAADAVALVLMSPEFQRR